MDHKNHEEGEHLRKDGASERIRPPLQVDELFLDPNEVNLIRANLSGQSSSPATFKVFSAFPNEDFTLKVPGS